MQTSPVHSFHIPVMGLAFTIDSPVKVARFGIASVISLADDRLIEMMRKHYYSVIDQVYEAIGAGEMDYRAKRITDYLNLVNAMVKTQIEKMKTAAFEAGSDIVRYFDMLPEDSPLKEMYDLFNQTEDIVEKETLEKQLRKNIQPGSIDVNIMTKLDRNQLDEAGEAIVDGSDAISALRGYVNSTLTNSSVVFSAGMNPRLFNYLENCNAFELNEDGNFDKKVIIKVSDYRSALIQGKILAKKGIWVSEFRVESGLNCGGHAFATDGFLLGPILEEFKMQRGELVVTIFELYKAALLKKNKTIPSKTPAIRFTVQGGIGTSEEDKYLRNFYEMDGTGWGTPFLLVPEATTVDEQTMQQLSKAKEKDIELSYHSPLGVRFHYLKGSTSEKERTLRISKGHPGSPCTEKHLSFNTEFTKEPICTASTKYQQLKIDQLQSQHLPENELQLELKKVMDKECLCVGLSNAASILYKETFIPKLHSVNVCPGPNIVNFSKVASLQHMVDHIYGRKNMVTRKNRPHMFVAELYLYIDYLKGEMKEDEASDRLEKKRKFYTTFYQNLRMGVQHYRSLIGLNISVRKQLMKDLYYAEIELDQLQYQYSLSAS